MEIKYSKGAEWRKWDLHIHTPASFCSEYGGDAPEIWDKFFAELENLPKEFKVIGINDYLFLDGYEKVLAYKNSGGLKNIDLILPVIEFRLKEFVGHQELKRINYHVIFANDAVLQVDQIKTQFLSGFKGKANLDSQYSNGYSWGGVITRETLQQYGQHILENTPAQKHGTNNLLEIGFNNINFELSKIKDLLGEGSEPNSYLQDKYLTAIGKAEWESFRWTGSPSDKKTIINDSHFVFSASPSASSSITSRESLKGQNVNSRLLHCSDAHGFSKDKTNTNPKELGHCFTWIKADPTFDGLKQVLIESEDRIFIGERPPIFDSVQNNRTKYLKKLNIQAVPGYKGNHGKWFVNTEIELNHELIAIIGNKGSGKTAIADILSHCAQFQNQDHFSFLNIKKFRDNGLANNFVATLTWESDTKDSKNLGEDVEQTSVELVKYLPQGYFEQITNEIDSTIGFQKEIEKVVFTHLDKDSKAGFDSFESLIEAKKVSVDRELQALEKDIETINKKIITLERKLHPKYKKELQNKIDAKKKEIDALSEPKAVSDPSKDKDIGETQKVILQKIDTLNAKINQLEGSISDYERKKLQAQIDLDELNNFKEEFTFKIKELTDFKKSAALLLDKHKLIIDTLLSVQSDLTPLNSLIDSKKNELNSIKILLGEENSMVPDFQSENLKLKNLQNDVRAEQEKLDVPQRAYQKYLQEIKLWQNKKNKLEGYETTPDTLRYLERELKYLNDTLDIDIRLARESRQKISKNIFIQKQQVVSIYKEIKTRIDNIIGANDSLLENYDINISASLNLEQNFTEIFFRDINQNVLGTFYAIEDGNIELTKITKSINFEEWENVSDFLNRIVSSIHEDKREKYKNEKRFIDEQLKNPLEFYNYLFSIKFLGYNYQLKQGSKNLQQLSPGERGALLLVFYLLLDNDDKPLIIDQPEDNLDNNSVANILVPFIRKAKGKRQIIIVTHNPNLAVVSDAEQIIYVNLEKDHENEFKFVSGSIEDREINKCIVKVLEGAMPAFNKRSQKYYK
jgi:ABC-type lipoprotein export system ATPase subunit